MGALVHRRPAVLFMDTQPARSVTDQSSKMTNLRQDQGGGGGHGVKGWIEEEVLGTPLSNPFHYTSRCKGRAFGQRGG